MSILAEARYDEILGPAVPGDAEAVPRYDIVSADGSVLYSNVTLKLKNPIITTGTPVTKKVLDECLAASGLTSGNAVNLLLAQENFTLFDGAVVRFRLHETLGASATLNVNNTGAYPLLREEGIALDAGVAAGAWITAIYSQPLGAFMVQGNAMKNLEFEVTIPLSGWADSRQSILDPRFKAIGYSYIVAAADRVFGEYNLCGVRALDVTEEGVMAFTYANKPTQDLYAKIMRSEVRHE